MNKIFVSILLSLCIKCFAQDLNWIKGHPLNDNGYHFGDNVSVDKFGNIYTSSMYRPDPYDPGASQTLQGSFLRKYRKTGELVWEVFNKGAEIWGSSVDENGNLYLGGRFFETMAGACTATGDSGKWSGFLSRLDTSGNCMWNKEIKGVYAMRIRSSSTGEAVYITGAMSNYYATFGCYNFQEQTYQYLAKYDNQGNCQWLRPIWNYGFVSNIEVNNELVAITGRYNFTAYFGQDSSMILPSSHIYNTYTALYDVNGNIKWARATVEPYFESESNSVALDKNNNVYVTGQVDYHNLIAGLSHTVTHGYDIFLVKYNQAGDTVCTHLLPGNHLEEGRAIYADNNGIYLSGTGYGKLEILDTVIDPEKVFFFIAKLNFDLTHTEWVKVYTTTGAHCEIFQITSDKENNIIACGDYDMDLTGDGVALVYNNYNYKKPFVMSIKELSPVLVTNGKGTAIDKGSMDVYPNPTTGKVTIVSQNKVKNGIIKIKNVVGELIYSREISSKGISLNEQVDLSHFPKGVYFIQICTGNATEVRKIVLE